MSNEHELLRGFVAGRLRALAALPEHPRKAALANLRRGVDCAPGDLPELWGAFLETLPPELEGKEGRPSKAEWAAYLAMTLYALHQQGHDLPNENMNRPGEGLGKAVRRLAVAKGEKPEDASVLRRFNALATAEAMPAASTRWPRPRPCPSASTICAASSSSCGPRACRSTMCAWPRTSIGCRSPPSRPGSASSGGRITTVYRKMRTPKRRTDMSLYVDIHVLQTVPPSCVNRDDTGSPKTARYGGVTRARVSSQAWKRAVRLMFLDLLDKEQVGVRTKKIVGMVAKEIDPAALKGAQGDLFGAEPGEPSPEAMKLAEKLLTAAGLKIKDAEKGTDALFLMSPGQAKALAQVKGDFSLLDKKKPTDAEKKVLAALKEECQKALKDFPSVDMALFGRMVADDPSLNFDAACQVAHAISTHAVQNEFDYFTAVDDCAPEDNAGAGHLGTVEFNSSTLYRYATVNACALAENLKADTPQAIRAFVEAFVRSMPTGKQNTFANRTLPDAVVVMLREDQPVNLCGAFEKPVAAKEDDGYGYVEASKKALCDYAKQVQDYVPAPAKTLKVGPDGTLAQVLDKLEAEVKERLGAE